MPLVAQAVVKSLGRLIESEPQKRQITGSQICRPGWGSHSEAFQENCYDERSRIVIRCVALGIVRNAEDSVLNDSRGVGHPVQVIQLDGGNLIQSFLRALRGEGRSWITQP